MLLFVSFYFCTKLRILIKPYKYKTLRQLGKGLYKEKSSKFIGLATSCYNEEEAKNLLENWKNEHHQAGHLCYAYRFGVEKDVFRTNDDGEPSNSAGAPILGQIQSYDLTNVLIGVVRYYGGTKLGVGGLINAYRTAAKEAIDATDIIVKELVSLVSLFFDYKEMPLIMDAVKSRQLVIDQQVFEDSCMLSVQIPLKEEADVLEKLGQFKSLTIKKIGIQ